MPVLRLNDPRDLRLVTAGQGVSMLGTAISDLALAALGGWQAMIVDAHVEVQYLAFALVAVLGFALRGRRSVAGVEDIKRQGVKVQPVLGTVIPSTLSICNTL